MSQLHLQLCPPRPRCFYFSSSHCICFSLLPSLQISISASLHFLVLSFSLLRGGTGWDMSYSHQLGAGSRVTRTIQPFPSGRQKPLGPPATLAGRHRAPGPPGLKGQRGPYLPTLQDGPDSCAFLHAHWPTAGRSSQMGLPWELRVRGPSADTLLPLKPVT